MKGTARCDELAKASGLAAAIRARIVMALCHGNLQALNLLHFSGSFTSSCHKSGAQ
ncbi:hypothetical protein [Undibacterium sp. KW1]|uniref:hypothetical protein n=1 Tax=Undibacterium sp. KW1 TaxID=2058624 RepID=UPI001389A266|nr:hypothetical protein [Undibacterium sp. KW1]